MARGPIKKTEALMVARLRLLGATQVEAAKAAGVCERSVAGWEAAEWWPEFQEQARTSVHDQVEAFALRTVLEAARDGDAGTARWVLERLRPKTWGAAQRVEHTGKDGEELKAQTVIILDTVPRLKNEPGDGR